MNILIFLIILLVLVTVHEFGHFFTAKKFGIRVDEFGFGFPPKLFGRKYGETEYTFNLLPLGGFVKIFGENPEDPPRLALGEAGENTVDPDEDRKFYNKAKWKQAIVLFAGVFANFILAWILFSIGFMSGLPTSVSDEPAGYELNDVNLTVISVVNDSPAHKALLESGDKIISVKSESGVLDQINPNTLKSFIVLHSEEEIEIGYVRGKDKNINLTKVVPQKDSTDGEARIGISMDMIGIAKLPVFSAFKEGMRLTLFVVQDTAFGLYTLVKEGLSGRGSFASVTGPVGIVGIVGNAYEFGFVYLLSFMALISVNLAIINLLPFPALDGGRLFFLLIEKIKGSRMNPKVVNTVNVVGFCILLFLMLVVTYHDVTRLF